LTLLKRFDTNERQKAESNVEECVIRRTMIVGVPVLAVVLAACGGNQADSATQAGEATMPAQAAGNVALSPSMQLSVGTLMLEDTALAVTQAQAQELLPLWQMLRALQESSTASQMEVEAVLGQIQEAMTPAQLAVIEEMDQGRMQVLVQELGIGGQGGTKTSEVGASPPPDVLAGGAAEGPAGMSPDGLTELGPGEQAALTTEGTDSGSETASTDAVVELLETRTTAS
jgi:hypothetical protein